MKVAKHPTPSAPCQVEWESRSYQLITFQTFPTGGGWGVARRGECCLTWISCVSVCSVRPHPALPRAQLPSVDFPGSCLTPHSFLCWSVLLFLSFHFLSPLLAFSSLSSPEFMVGSGETRPGRPGRGSLPGLCLCFRHPGALGLVWPQLGTNPLCILGPGLILSGHRLLPSLGTLGFWGPSP